MRTPWLNVARKLWVPTTMMITVVQISVLRASISSPKVRRTKMISSIHSDVHLNSYVVRVRRHDKKKKANVSRFTTANTNNKRYIFFDKIVG